MLLNLLAVILCSGAVVAPATTPEFAQEPTAGQPPKAQAEEPELWFGELDAGVVKLRMLLKLRRSHGDQSASGVVISLDQGGAELKLDQIALEEGKLTFRCSQVQAAYEGKMNDAGDTVDGTFTQLGRPRALVLRKIAKPPRGEALETWEGTLVAGPRKLLIRFRMLELDAGKKTYRMDSVDERVMGLAAAYTQKDEEVRWEVSGLKVSFVGKLSEDGESVQGIWRQGGNDLPFSMRRVEAKTDAPPPPRKRPQTPQPPFPYSVEEMTIANESADVVLGATLTLPKTPGPHPALVLVSGSGPQDRDETILGHRPFALWADTLTRKGVAVLRFDDRGVGKSTGSFAAATTEDFLSDVLACVDHLSNDDRIDPARIGVMGHSEGGLIAPMAAVKRPDLIAAIVLLAGPSVDGRTILRSQNRLIMEAAGAPEKQVEAQVELVDLLVGAALKSPDPQDFEKNMAQTIATLLEKFPESERQAYDPTPLARSSFSQFATPWFRFFLEFDPKPMLQQVNCPTLCVYGEKDLQVDPKLNIPVLREAFAGREGRLTVHEFPGLNHLFQTTKTGSPSEYETLEETIAPEALKDVSDWIVKTIGHVKQ